MKPIKAHLKFSGVWGIIFFLLFPLLPLHLFYICMCMYLCLYIYFLPFLCCFAPAFSSSILLCFLCLMVLCHDIRGWILKWVPLLCPCAFLEVGREPEQNQKLCFGRGKWPGARQKIFISIRHKNLLKMNAAK